MLRFARSLSLALAALLAAASPAPARADAGDASRVATVSGFDRIALDGAFTVAVTAGAAGTRVVVTGAPDDVARVTFDVRGDTLQIGMKSGESRSERSPHVTISLPVLRGFVLAGAGSATIAGVGGGDLDLAVPGSGSITASGRAGHERIDLDGSGTIDARAVAARDATVSNRGVGAVYVRAAGTLVVTIDGVGEVRYAGNPAHLTSNVRGVGTIGPL